MPEYDVDQPIGIYRVSSEGRKTVPPEERTYHERARITPKGFTADSDGAVIRRIVENFDAVTLETLDQRFTNHGQVVIPPGDVPGELIREGPPVSAADLNYEGVIHPDEVGDLEPGHLS